MLDAVVTAILLRSFDYREYNGTGWKKDDEKPVALNISIIGAKSLQGEIDRAGRDCLGAELREDESRPRPGNVINPPSLAKVAQEMAKEAKLSCRVMDEKETGQAQDGRNSGRRVRKSEDAAADDCAGAQACQGETDADDRGQSHHLRHRWNFDQTGGKRWGK